MFQDDSFHARKAQRTAYYKKYVEGWKQVPCGACNGSGKYDNTDRRGRQPDCGACEGTGKERLSPEKYRQHVEMIKEIYGEDWKENL